MNEEKIIYRPRVRRKPSIIVSVRSSESTVDGRSAVFGILGHPVAHSLSPLLHNLGFQFKGINAVYVPFAVETVSPALKKGILALGIKGLSVTIPHKTWAAKIADQSDDLTRCSGAANTLIRSGDELHAHNTDGPGALRALEYRLKQLRGLRYLLIGYGGSATAIAHALLLKGYPSLLGITGRNRKKCASFADALNQAHRPGVARRILEAELEPNHFDVIINTTPLGMEGKEALLPVPVEFLHRAHTVFDIVYTPQRTPLLALAERRGAKTIPGYLMLLYQALLQFELFTGEKAPEALLEKELLRALRKKSEASRQPGRK